MKATGANSIKIPFSGMNRSTDIGLAPDGQMMELINARIKNDSVQPINPPIAITEALTDVRRVYYHPKASKVLVLHSDSVEAYEEDFTFYETLSTDLGSNVNDIAILGNVLCFLTDTEILYVIWDGDTYRYIGEIPDVPGISVSLSTTYEQVTPDSYYWGYGSLAYDLAKYDVSGSDMEELDDSDFKQTMLYSHVGFIDNAIDTLNKAEYMEGPCFVRHAFRTSSGAWIKVSAPWLVENPTTVTISSPITNSAGTQLKVQLSQAYPFTYFLTTVDSENLNDYGIFSTDKSFEYSAFAMGTKLTFSFSEDFDYTYLDSLIVGIDVFISPVSWYEKEEVKRNTLTFERYVYQDDEKAQLLKAYNFYKVAEFSLDGEELWRLDDWSKDNIAVQELLVDDETKHGFSASSHYVYNSRVHLGNLTYSFTPGNGSQAFLGAPPTDDTTDDQLITYTELSTEYGTSVIANGPLSVWPYLSPFITYPDSRAKKMTLYLGVDGVISKTEVQLQKHPYLEMAYYCDPTARFAASESGTSVSLLTDTLNEEAMYLNADWEVTDTSDYPDETGTTYSQPNAMRVSSLNDPVSFPSDQAYLVGDYTIIGMRSNTSSLSQGQFGQYPLYIFCTDGVFAASVDSTGSLVYSTISPVSRDVCTNVRSICGTDHSVAFATQRGLMAISGVQVECLSGAIDGWVPTCMDSSEIIPKIAAVAQMYTDTEDDGGNTTREYFLSILRFKDYITGAEVGFNYRENELIVANGSYPYAYVYNIPSASWSKIGVTVSSFTNHYPELYAVCPITGEDDTYGVYQMQNDYCTVAKVLMLTRPIRLGTNAPKRIFQIAIRGIVKRALSDLYLRGEQVQFRDEELDIFSDVGMYLLGSHDAEHFVLLDGKESIVDIRDLITKTNKTKHYKYFMLCLAGGVRSDVALNYIEVAANTSFDNRLR